MDINAIQNYMRVQPAAGASARPVRPVQETAAVAADSRIDKVNISSEASFRAQLGAQARTYSAKAAEPASAERISQLKAQYEGDSCPVRGADIASAIMKYSLGGALNIN